MRLVQTRAASGLLVADQPLGHLQTILDRGRRIGEHRWQSRFDHVAAIEPVAADEHPRRSGGGGLSLGEDRDRDRVILDLLDDFPSRVD